MSEEFSTDYKDGDIVWVKLGPSWWPGEIKDLSNIPSDEIEFKKQPLAVVKFFEEDTYEYVRNWANIYHYNCEKKAEFIKKGMAAFRTKASHMEKFPKDVTIAEIKLGGNPNILSDPAFRPESKRNYMEIYGSSSPKKSLKDKKSRSSTKQNLKDTTHITHRRFLGVDDYKAYICIQYPGKDRIPGDSEDDEVIRINTEKEQEYNCHSCPYSTKRLEVMILHTKSHIQGVYVSSPRRKRPVTGRPKKKEYVRKKVLTYSDNSSSEDILEPPKEKKRKSKVVPSVKKTAKKVLEDVNPKPITDIRNDLLAEWEDTDDEFDNSIFDDTSKLSETLDSTKVSKLDETNDLSKLDETNDLSKLDETNDLSVKELDVETKEIENDIKDVSDIESEPIVINKEPKLQIGKESSPKVQMDKETQEAIKSCFDFDEDDEEDVLINTTVEVGRKIPRVIPPTEKRKSEILEDIIDLEEGINKEEILKVSQSFNERTSSKEKEVLESEFKDLMETTSVPELSEIENSLKPTQNFHVVTTIKFPDKPDESPKKDRDKNLTEVPINPKKRFVKSFEDFENQLQKEENRRKEEEQLKLKENIKQVFQEAKSSISQDKSSLIQDVTSEEKKDSLTKEAFDSSDDDKGIDLSKLQSSIMSKIIDEAKIPDSSRYRIMSKMKNRPREKILDYNKIPQIERRLSSRNRNEQKSSLIKEKTVPKGHRQSAKNQNKDIKSLEDSNELDKSDSDQRSSVKDKKEVKRVQPTRSSSIKEKNRSSLLSADNDNCIADRLQSHSLEKDEICSSNNKHEKEMLLIETIEQAKSDEEHCTKSDEEHCRISEDKLTPVSESATFEEKDNKETNRRTSVEDKIAEVDETSVQKNMSNLNKTEKMEEESDSLPDCSNRNEIFQLSMKETTESSLPEFTYDVNDKIKETLQLEEKSSFTEESITPELNSALNDNNEQTVMEEIISLPVPRSLRSTSAEATDSDNNKRVQENKDKKVSKVPFKKSRWSRVMSSPKKHIDPFKVDSSHNINQNISLPVKIDKNLVLEITQNDNKFFDKVTNCLETENNSKEEINENVSDEINKIEEDTSKNNLKVDEPIEDIQPTTEINIGISEEIHSKNILEDKDMLDSSENIEQPTKEINIDMSDEVYPKKIPFDDTKTEDSMKNIEPTNEINSEISIVSDKKDSIENTEPTKEIYTDISPVSDVSTSADTMEYKFNDPKDTQTELVIDETNFPLNDTNEDLLNKLSHNDKDSSAFGSLDSPTNQVNVQSSIQNEDLSITRKLPEDAICEPISKPNKRKKGRRKSSRFTTRKKRKFSKDKEDAINEADTLCSDIETDVKKDIIEEKYDTEFDRSPKSCDDNKSVTVSNTTTNCNEVAFTETSTENNFNQPNKDLQIEGADVEAVEDETIFEVTIEQDSSKSHVDTDTEIMESEEIIEKPAETEVPQDSFTNKETDEIIAETEVLQDSFKTEETIESEEIIVEKPAETEVLQDSFKTEETIESEEIIEKPAETEVVQDSLKPKETIESEEVIEKLAETEVLQDSFINKETINTNEIIEKFAETEDLQDYFISKETIDSEEIIERLTETEVHQVSFTTKETIESEEIIEKLAETEIQDSMETIETEAIIEKLEETTVLQQEAIESEEVIEKLAETEVLQVSLETIESEEIIEQFAETEIQDSFKSKETIESEEIIENLAETDVNQDSFKTKETIECEEIIDQFAEQEILQDSTKEEILSTETIEFDDIIQKSAEPEILQETIESEEIIEKPEVFQDSFTTKEDTLSNESLITEQTVLVETEETISDEPLITEKIVTAQQDVREGLLPDESISEEPLITTENAVTEQHVPVTTDELLSKESFSDQSLITEENNMTEQHEPMKTEEVLSQESILSEENALAEQCISVTTETVESISDEPLITENLINEEHDIMKEIITDYPVEVQEELITEEHTIEMPKKSPTTNLLLETENNEEHVEVDQAEEEITEKSVLTEELVTNEDESKVTEETVKSENLAAVEDINRKLEEIYKASAKEKLLDSLFKFPESKLKLDRVGELSTTDMFKSNKSISFHDSIDDEDDKLTDLVSDIVQKLSQDESDRTQEDLDIENIQDAAYKNKQTKSHGDTFLEKPKDDDSEPSKELEILCSNSSNDSFKFSIQTNLTNLSRSEEISAIALATLSEMKIDLESKADLNFPEKLSDTEMVAIEGNLTVMSEKDLADAQVEITTDKVMSSRKPVMLSNFSMDFSDSTSDSGSINEVSNEATKFTDFGTEFSSRAITKELKPKTLAKKINTYDQCELLDILEGNAESEKKAAECKTFTNDIMDFEECIPSQIVCSKEYQKNIDNEMKKKDKSSSVISTTSKLFERLTDTKNFEQKNETLGDGLIKIVKNQKLKAKPIILSEQIIKPAVAESKKTSPTNNNTVNDIEDVEAFVIHKDLKKSVQREEPKLVQVKTARKSRAKPTGKAKILQQTIITPAGEIIQPAVSLPKKKLVPVANLTRITTDSLPSVITSNASKPSATVVSNVSVDSTNQDDNIFDIFNMPIVLSDQILTPESIENMPIVIDGNSAVTKPAQTLVSSPTTKIPATKVVPKVIPSTTPTLVSSKTPTITHKQKPRILQSAASKPTLPSAVLPQKPGKYIIVSQSSPGIPLQKHIPKKTIMKRTALSTTIGSKPGISQEITGNKIMVVTNQQGQQQRLLLTPAQQKVLGYQSPSGPKLSKTVVKTNVLQKNLTPILKTDSITSKTTSLLSQKIVATTSQVPASTLTPKLQKTVIKNRAISNQKTTVTINKTPKTILITNKHGQTIKKIATTEDDIDKQVAEQLEAIKASTGMHFGIQSKSDIANNKSAPKTPTRSRPSGKKPEPRPKVTPTLARPDLTNPPPLVSTTKKPIASTTETKKIIPEETKPQLDRPLNQLVIQDALGNQTTITEGQILALPSETVDGQPQSYMLVTLDQSGNLTPLNNEALMSLDPNLGLGGDLSNMVLQIDQGSLGGSSVDQPMPLAQPATVKLTNPGEELQAGTSKIDIPRARAPLSLPVANDLPSLEPKVHQTLLPVPAEASVNIESIVSNSNSEQGQQLIVTGDPIATQKFLESLTEGTTDLANIIANAEGKSILIQADGQQILINTNTDSNLLPNVDESTEGGGNPIFSTLPSKNTDILAAALADTDVFTSQPKISQLSPNNALYPMNVGNVLETSLTLNSPIMTPLEITSTNNKKIPDDEADILTQVPKNVDLPITITDPNIAQTVANQQATLMANELHTNLELGLGISETTISTGSSCLTSPGYSYSLSTLDENDISHKSFSSSMPLLNDDVEEASSSNKSQDKDEDKNESNLASERFLEEESRFTLGGGMCSSLSEPPPEMFDIPDVNSYGEKNGNNIPLSLQSTPDPKDDDTTDISMQTESSSEGSCEIPLQPKIVAKSDDLSDVSEM